MIFSFQYADLQAEIEEYKELAAGRLAELEKLMSDHETTKREVEVLKNKVNSIKSKCISDFKTEVIFIIVFSFVHYQKSL